ncbi:hypothetical protein PR202_ga29275 [Eleusine coracana subsp. coracana]|uniref:Uncharacterized protein n=1 Tax=Eleusine coracana subsp. coracana TaxID=191504 RepID=A0AAV5DLF9_ELECO|nr:hypothetical protein PR202_ga29275 [Eleusine coracana subsp. coracana]
MPSEAGFSVDMEANGILRDRGTLRLLITNAVGVCNLRKAEDATQGGTRLTRGRPDLRTPTAQLRDAMEFDDGTRGSKSSCAKDDGYIDRNHHLSSGDSQDSDCCYSEERKSGDRESVMEQINPSLSEQHCDDQKHGREVDVRNLGFVYLRFNSKRASRSAQEAFHNSVFEGRVITSTFMSNSLYDTMFPDYWTELLG